MPERRQAKRSDPLTPAQRRHNMQRIRGRDTKPELLLRRALHALGLRYRLHQPNLPGKPDLVLSRWRAAIFVHGCFWHGHDCPFGVLPQTNAVFWALKIASNRRRDEARVLQLQTAGWRVAIVWQCALTGRNRIGYEETGLMVRDWLADGGQLFELRGNDIDH